MIFSCFLLVLPDSSFRLSAFFLFSLLLVLLFTIADGGWMVGARDSPAGGVVRELGQIGRDPVVFYRHISHLTFHLFSLALASLGPNTL